MLAGAEAVDDVGGEEGGELVDGAAELDDLADEGGTGEGVLVAGHDEDGVDPPYRAVGLGELEFVAEVDGVADAAEDGGGVGLADEVDGQAGEGFDAGIGEVGDEFLNHGDAVGEGEHLALVGVDADGDDEVVEEE